nr:MAG TPA: hypothetical protein [Bacteriophage sp.]
MCNIYSFETFTDFSLVYQKHIVSIYPQDLNRYLLNLLSQEIELLNFD